MIRARTPSSSSHTPRPRCAVKMLTATHAGGSEIGQGVGLPNIKRMADLRRERTAENKTVDLFAGADGFAEVFPETIHSCKHLQAAGT